MTVPDKEIVWLDAPVDETVISPEYESADKPDFSLAYIVVDPTLPLDWVKVSEFEKDEPFNETSKLVGAVTVIFADKLPPETVVVLAKDGPSPDE